MEFYTFRLPDGSLMEITKVYPLDAVFDSPDDVPEEVLNSSSYGLLNIILIISYSSAIAIFYSGTSGAGKNKQTLCRILKLDCSGIILSVC